MTNYVSTRELADILGISRRAAQLRAGRLDAAAWRPRGRNGFEALYRATDLGLHV